MIVIAELRTLYRQRLLFWLFTVGGLIVAPLAGMMLAFVFSGAGGPPAQAIQILTTTWYASISGPLILIIAVTAGTADYRSGVLRDYFGVGVARWKLYVAQAAAGLVLIVGAVGIGLMLTALISGLGSERREEASFVYPMAAIQVVGLVSLAALIGHGTAALIRSRGLALAAIFGWVLAIEPMVHAVAQLAVGLDDPPFEKIGLTASVGKVIAGTVSPESVSTTQPFVTLAVWAFALWGLGLARTIRSDA